MAASSNVIINIVSFIKYSAQHVAFPVTCVTELGVYATVQHYAYYLVVSQYFFRQKKPVTQNFMNCSSSYVLFSLIFALLIVSLKV